MILSWHWNNYYQKVGPNQILSSDQQQYIQFGGNAISMNQRKVLYATSFKKASFERSNALINYNQYKMEFENKASINFVNNSRLILDNAKKQTPSHFENQRKRILNRKQTKDKIDNKLWVYGSNKR